MIKINLLGEELPQDNDARLWILGYVFSLIIFVAIAGFMYVTTAGENQKLESQAARLEGDLNRIKEITKEVRDLEAKRKQLSEILTIIATLKRNKSGPVRVLDDLNMAVPEKAWVTQVAERSGQLKITGYALDNETIASFMRALEKSDYIRSVDLEQTRQTIFSGSKIMEFSLQVSISYAGKLAAIAAEAIAKKKAEEEAKKKEKQKKAPKPASKGDDE